MRFPIVKFRSIATTLAGVFILPATLFSTPPATAQVIFGNVGSEAVSGVVGSGANHPPKTIAAFDGDVQAKVNAASAKLTVASISDTQTVLGQTIVSDPQVAQTAFDLINTPVGTTTPNVDSFSQSLGNSSSAKNLAAAMQGLRQGDGSIDPNIMTNAVNAYNSYVQALVTDTNATTKPTTELDRYIQSLPPGQKVAQVLLGKLLEAAR
jgi:hypothetical protein